MIPTTLRLNNGGLLLNSESNMTQISSTGSTISMLPSVTTNDIILAGESVTLKMALEKLEGFNDSPGSIKSYVDSEVSNATQSLQTDVASLQTDVASLQTDVASLQTDVASGGGERYYADLMTTYAIVSQPDTNIITAPNSLNSIKNGFTASSTYNGLGLTYSGVEPRTFQVAVSFRPSTSTASGDLYIMVNGTPIMYKSAYDAFYGKTFKTIKTLTPGDVIILAGYRSTSSSYWALYDAQLTLTEV